MNKSRLLGAACATLLTFGSNASVHAATLLGTGTLNAADDLTVIMTGDGEIWEWLDLTPTNNMSVSEALSLYQGDGFHWATGSDITELYSAFGITYGAIRKGVYDLGIDANTAHTYASYIGATFSFSSLGWIDDLTTGKYHTHDCVGIDCETGSFVSNTFLYWPSLDSIGVYLVREASTVPIPATVWLFGSGLLGLVGAARRKKA